MKRRICCAACLTALYTAASPVSADWTPLGPSPIISSPISSYTGVEGMPTYGNPSVGAMNIVLESPDKSGTLYVGTANGGVWKSLNAGQSWTVLTDRLSSLSIGDMTFDRSDPSKLYIGFGKQSNYAENGGPLNSIKMSIDGGTTWDSPDSAKILLGRDIVKMFVDKNLMLVGIKNPYSGETGLYRSTTGAGGLALLATTSGLAEGKISDLKADPLKPLTFYASVLNSTATSGVYKSIDSGATWERLNNIPTTEAGTKRILLATSGSTLVAGVVNGTKYDETVFYRSTNGGASWSSMTQPVTTDRDRENGQPQQGLFPSPQFNNAALAIDPNNPNIIYVSGVRQPDDGTDKQFPNSIGAYAYSGRIFRGVFNADTGLTTWEPLTNIGTTNNSSPHADSRSIFIDSAGRLIQTDDGGIYTLSNRQGKGEWTPLNGNIQVSEVDASSWNPLANIAVAGMQDNGSVYQIKGGTRWGMISAGDGGANAVNWQTFGNDGIAVIYGSNQYLGGLSRFTMARDGSVDPESTTPLYLYRVENGREIPVNTDKARMPFYPSLILNRYEQTRFAVGGYSLFTGTDDLSLVNSKGIRVQVQEIVSEKQVTGVKSDGFGSIAYGAKDRPDAILAGIGDQMHGALTSEEVQEENRYGQLWYSDNAQNIAPVRLTGFDTVDVGGTKPGRSIQSLVFDGRSGSANFYVADGNTIWRGTRNNDPATLYSFDSLSANLPAGFIARRAVEYVAHNGVNALLAGGLHSTTANDYVNPIYYTIDPAVKNGAVWTPLGRMLPNAPVFALHYSDIDDVLLASTLGRGLFAMYDFTTYFTEATSLTFGQADNDSKPDATQLTDGLTNGVVFSRPLIKVGTGTLDLTAQSGYYSGGTQFKGGITVAGTENNFGSGGFLFDGGTLRFTTGNSISRPLQILGAGGTVVTDSSPLLQLSGPVSGYGTLRYGGVMDIRAVPLFSPTPVTTPTLGSAITLLQADGGILGTVAAVQQPANLLPGTRYDVVYNPAALSFLATPASFTDLRSSGIILSGARTSVAAALDALRPAHLSVPSGEAKTLFDALYRQNAGGLAVTFDQLGGSSYATSLTASLAASRLSISGLRSRIEQRTGGTETGLARFAYNTIRITDRTGAVVANDAAPVPSSTRTSQNMLWGYGFGRFEQGKDDPSAPGYSMTTAGGMSGFDHDFGTGWLGGIAAGYARTSTSQNNSSGSSDVDACQIMVYGGYGKETGPILQASLGGSFDAYTNRRSILIGTYSAAPTSTAGGNSLFSSIAGGWRFGLGRFSLEPSVSLDYANSSREASAESGTLIALSVSTSEINTFRLHEAIRGTVQLDRLFGLTIIPEIRLGLAQELLDRNATVTALLAGHPISSESPRLGRELFNAGAGLTVASGERLAFCLEYNAELREGANAHTVSGGFRVAW
jgi:uncharacterized protein with beta-barrel porin domain